jgi:hypothetical protein
MKNGLIKIVYSALILTAAPAVLASASLVSTEECFSRISSSNFNYSILVPHCWEKTQADLNYMDVIVLRKGRYSEIKVSASRVTDKELYKWETWKDWYLRGRGSAYTDIIEKEDIDLGGNAKGKLIILEYTSGGRRIIQRILIARNSETMVVIECAATIDSFYKYSDIFNTVMGSLIFSGNETKDHDKITEKNDKGDENTDIEKKSAETKNESNESNESEDGKNESPDKQ